MPRTVGRVELALFVLVPALLPLIFGGQFRSALVTAGANLLLLLLIYAVVGYGLLAIVRWVFARLLSQLASALGLLAKAVPLLMIFALLSFTNQEMWQIFSDDHHRPVLGDPRPLRRPRLGLPARPHPARGARHRARGGDAQPAARAAASGSTSAS